MHPQGLWQNATFWWALQENGLRYEFGYKSELEWNDGRMQIEEVALHVMWIYCNVFISGENAKAVLNSAVKFIVLFYLFCLRSRHVHLELHMESHPMLQFAVPVCQAKLAYLMDMFSCLTWIGLQGIGSLLTFEDHLHTTHNAAAEYLIILCLLFLEDLEKLF